MINRLFKTNSFVNDNRVAGPSENLSNSCPESGVSTSSGAQPAIVLPNGPSILKKAPRSSSFISRTPLTRTGSTVKEESRPRSTSLNQRPAALQRGSIVPTDTKAVKFDTTVDDSPKTDPTAVDRPKENSKFGHDYLRSMMSTNCPPTYDNARLLTMSGKIDPLESAFGAAEIGNLDVLKFFMGRKPIDDITVPLMIAAARGHLDIVKYLYPQLKLLDQDDDDRRNSALRAASKNGHLHVVSYLIVDVKCNDVIGCLKDAINKHHQDIIDWILAHPELSYDRNSAMIMCAKKGFQEGVLFFATHGAENFDGALKEACRNGHLPVVKYLIEEKKACVQYGLSFAITEGQIEIVLHIMRNNNIKQV